MRAPAPFHMLLLLALNFCIYTAHAQIRYEDFLHPKQPARNDAIFVSYGLTCGHPELHPGFLPQVVRTVGDLELEVTVDIYLRSAGPVICFATPPGPTYAMVDVGSIPADVMYVRATRRAWLVDDNGQTPLVVSQDVVAIDEIPGNSITGVWWAPVSPGALTNLLLASHPGSTRGDLIVTTQQLDADGDVVMMTAIGKFDGPEFTAPALIPTRAGAGQNEVVADEIGMLRLTYQGCRKVLLQFESANADVDSFVQHLEQISWPYGVPGCELNPSFILPSVPVASGTVP